MSNDLTFIAADGVASGELHAAVLASFADYLAGPFQLTPAQWPSFLARQGVDLAASRAAVRGNEIVAFALVSRRADNGRWRLAVMGALPAARGSGAAPALLDNLFMRAQGAGIAQVELECFAQNERALKLYRGRGFEVVHALRGWNWPATAGEATDGALSADTQARAPQAAVREVDRATAFAWLADAARRIGHLPLGVTSTALAAAVRPLLCWQAGGAQLVLSVVEDTPIQVHSLIDDSADQRDAFALVQALSAAFPGESITVPPLQRDDLGGDALRRAGFEPQALHQVLMVRNLVGARR